MNHPALTPGQYVVLVTLSWQDAQQSGDLAAPNPTAYGTASESVTVMLR